MTKSSGLGAALVVGGYDISNDIGSVNTIGGGYSTLDVTGIDKTAIERLGAARTGTVDLTAFFNPETGRSHERFSALPTADQLMTYTHRQTRGTPAFAMSGVQLNYDGTRGADGALGFTVSNMSDGFGGEWGHTVTTVGESSSGAENLAGFDDGAGAATDFGLQAYLFVTAFTGTSATVTLEDSDDDGAGDAYAAIAGGAFGAASAVGAERIQTGRTENVKEWVRCAVSGTYSALELTVVVVRNTTAVVF